MIHRASKDILLYKAGLKGYFGKILFDNMSSHCDICVCVDVDNLQKINMQQLSKGVVESW